MSAISGMEEEPPPATTEPASEAPPSAVPAPPQAAVAFTELQGEEPPSLEGALARALHPSFKPSPRAVTGRDVDSPRWPTELEAASHAAWCNGEVMPWAPTTQMLRWDAKEALRLASTPRDMLARQEAERARPDATAPSDMAQFWCAEGWEAMAPAVFVALPERPLLPGQLPAANIPALFAAHVATGACEDCNAARPCSIGAVCNLLQSISWPWKEGKPPPPATSVPAAQPYDPLRTEHAQKLIERGVYREIHDPSIVKAWGNVLDAPRRNPVLSEDELATIASSGSAAAVAAATPRAQLFVATLTESLASGASPYAAWETAAAAAFPEVAHRQVIDLSGWKSACIKLKMRYATLRPILEFVSETVRLGTIDLKSGYSQLCLSPDASLYTGLALQLEPGGPARYFVHDRLPQGGGPSAGIFSLYTGLIDEIFKHRARARQLSARLATYLDDLLLAALAADADEVQRLLQQLLKEVRATANSDKSLGTMTSTKSMLGLVVTTSPPGVRQTPQAMVRALVKAMVLQTCARQRTAVPERALPSLAGSVQWLCYTDPHVAAHTRGVARCMAGLAPKWWSSRGVWSWSKEPRAGAPTTAQLLNEMDWFLSTAAAGGISGSRILTAARAVPTVFFASDATGPSNTVAVVGETVVIRFALPDCAGVALPVLEGMALPLLAMVACCKGLRNCDVVWAADALGMAYWVAARKAARNEANDLMRLLTLVEEKYNIRFLIKWLSRVYNFTSDRGAAEAWEQVEARGISLPALRMDITLQGLPCEFLAAWAKSLDPAFEFSTADWERVNSRGAPS